MLHILINKIIIYIVYTIYKSESEYRNFYIRDIIIIRLI